MPRVKAPLIKQTDAEVLRMAARRFELDAGLNYGREFAVFRRAMAARLREIARRVPLWTDRKGVS
jgi:hypothetical protein